MLAHATQAPAYPHLASASKPSRQEHIQGTEKAGLTLLDASRAHYFTSYRILAQICRTEQSMSHTTDSSTHHK